MPIQIRRIANPLDALIALALLVVSVLSLRTTEIGVGPAAPVYFSSVAMAGRFWGRWPAILLLALGALVLDFVFLPPKFSLALATPNEGAILARSVLAAVAFLALVTRARSQTREEKIRLAVAAKGDPSETSQLECQMPRINRVGSEWEFLPNASSGTESGVEGETKAAEVAMLFTRKTGLPSTVVLPRRARLLTHIRQRAGVLGLEVEALRISGPTVTIHFAPFQDRRTLRRVAATPWKRRRT